MGRDRAALVLVGIGVMAAACTRATPAPSPAPAPSSSSPSAAAAPKPEEANDPRFHADLVSIANAYREMTRADGTWWGPEDCRAPPPPPSFASRAEKGPHGRKLYTLFIKDYPSYAALAPQLAAPAQPGFLRTPPSLEKVSQAIVKEAWTPVETARKKEGCKPPAGGPVSSLGPVMMDGREFSACELAALFVMFRPQSGPEGTDEGWVYGTVQLDARPTAREGQWSLDPRVTSSGRVASCMGCHLKAPHGRLFGPRSP